MKIAFDEHVPVAMVRVFDALAKERQFQKLCGDFEFVFAKTYAPRRHEPDYLKRNDAPWIRRFAADGGKVIISGNTKMKKIPHERLALVETGMAVFFFESGWNEWPFWRKCSLLMHWWPLVATKARRARRSSFWHIPSHWPSESKMKLRRVSNKDTKMAKIERQKSSQRTVRKKRLRKPHPDQVDLEDLIKNMDRPDA